MRTHFPSYLKKQTVLTGCTGKVETLLSDFHLATVCRSARCPNRNECFSRCTATFLLLGEICTRGCRFCAIARGVPQLPDPLEPLRVADASRTMELKHVVLTSVTRDDLADGGAEQFRQTVLAIRDRLPQASIELLIPDFGGNNQALQSVLSARPDVLNHNVETVPRLYGSVRSGADYERSLRILGEAKKILPSVVTKSGLMLGLGETEEEILDVMTDLREAGCMILTMGQYLSPGPGYHPVKEFVLPETFDDYARRARELGFGSVVSGPFVRSSYRAREALEQCLSNGKEIL